MPKKRITDAALRRQLRGMAALAREMTGAYHPDEIDQMRREIDETLAETLRRLPKPAAKPRRRHSRSGDLRCEICSPLRCAYSRGTLP